MNIKKIKIPCETIPRCGVNPRDSPTVAMAEVVFKQTFGQRQRLHRADDKRSRQRKDEIQCKNSCGIMDRFFFHPPPNISGLFCLRNTANALATSTAAVVVLMPPAVEPGEPPMNISRMVRRARCWTVTYSLPY